MLTLKKLFLSNVCHINTLKLCAVTVLKLMFKKKNPDHYCFIWVKDIMFPGK